MQPQAATYIQYPLCLLSKCWLPASIARHGMKADHSTMSRNWAVVAALQRAPRLHVCAWCDHTLPFDDQHQKCLPTGFCGKNNYCSNGHIYSSMWCTMQGMDLIASSNLLALQQLPVLSMAHSHMCRVFGTHLQRKSSAHASHPRCQRREVPLHVQAAPHYLWASNSHASTHVECSADFCLLTPSCNQADALRMYM